ncbi:hypothetical protein OROMI_009205 [Orobanche minor]
MYRGRSSRRPSASSRLSGSLLQSSVRRLPIFILAAAIDGALGYATVTGTVFCDQCKYGQVSLFDYPLHGNKKLLLRNKGVINTSGFSLQDTSGVSLSQNRQRICRSVHWPSSGAHPPTTQHSPSSGAKQPTTQYSPFSIAPTATTQATTILWINV